MQIEDLIKTAEEKYQFKFIKDLNILSIKFDYFTISIKANEVNLLVKIKRGNNCEECLFNFKTLQEMFNKNVNKILDFIIYRIIEYYYAERCKKLF